MPLIVTDESKMQAGTPRVSLKKGLETLLFQTYKASKTGAALIDTWAGQQSKNKLAIVIKPGKGGGTGADTQNNVITLYAGQIVLDKQGKEKPDGLQELGETVLFEMQNAVNAAANQLALRQLQGAEKSKLDLHAYGLGKAKREAECSFTLSAILSELPSTYKPSAFGQGHLTAVGKQSRDEFLSFFAKQPHDGQAKNKLLTSSLPTADMYSFEAVSKLPARYFATKYLKLW